MKKVIFCEPRDPTAGDFTPMTTPMSLRDARLFAARHSVDVLSRRPDLSWMTKAQWFKDWLTVNNGHIVEVVE